LENSTINEVISCRLNARVLSRGQIKGQEGKISIYVDAQDRQIGQLEAWKKSLEPFSDKPKTLKEDQGKLLRLEREKIFTGPFLVSGASRFV